ncbi:hypothetical protein WR25_23016 [Diploscapter pachys]|uniref:G-protein coupled receptors family 1 profile domain-containing protein n=1 Tax=Diploscapter pachys TaxID=2018661 RepID=A0A2A2KYF4_9BILA|nr:hypothetical protein WR25_23016 [Diploscapter pachys]
MSASDLCVCVLVIPCFGGKVLEVVLREQLPVFVTLYSYPICVMFQAMSVGFLVAITIDRYLAVCYPFKVTTYCTSSRALFTVSFIVVISVAYNFVRFWEYEIVLDDNRTETLSLLLRADPQYMLWYQNVATLITQFIIPLIVLCVLNLQVARTIINAAEQRKELVAKERREHSTAKMMIFVVIVFLVCYIFSFVLNVTEIFFPDLFQENRIGYVFNDINNILVVVNSSTAFIFYMIYSTRFRNQLRTLYGIRFFTARLKFMQSAKSRSMSMRNNTFCADTSASYYSVDYTSKSQKTSRATSGIQSHSRKNTNGMQHLTIDNNNSIVEPLSV